MTPGRGLVPTRSEGAGALASAALFFLSFPPIPLVVPVFLCLVPLAVAVAERADASDSARSAARIGFWFAIFGFGTSLYWIAIALAIYTKLAIVGYAATVAAVAAICAAITAMMFVARRSTRLPMAVLLPAAWVTFEIVLTYLPDLAFPWLPLGLAMADVPVLAQAADLSGVHGLSFWIAATNGLFADAWLARSRPVAVVTRIALAGALAAAVAAYGAWRMATTSFAPVAAVAVVQPNVPQEEKWQAQNQGRILGMLTDLTSQAQSRRDAQLIVWPEAALPGFLPEHPEWSQALAGLARATGTPIVFGVLDLTVDPSGGYEYYNAAMLADSTGRLDAQPPYHKTYLVPVVERVPFLNPRWFAKLKYFGGYGIGRDPHPFRLGFGSVGVLICYESIFPQRSRLYRRDGAVLILNITNDAWFGRTLAPYQHAAHLNLRAIETRMGIVRAANTGISEFVDPLGVPHGATELFEPATRTYRAVSTSIITPYVRFGDWIGTIGILILVWGQVQAWRVRRRP